MKNFSLLIIVSFISLLSLGKAFQNDPCTSGLLPSSQLTIGAPCAPISKAGMSFFVNPGSCGSDNADDGWAWVLGDGNNMTVTLSSISHNAVMHVYEVNSPPCAGISNVWCSNNILTSNEVISFPSIAGTTYLIRIQRDNSHNTMTGCLGVTSVIPIFSCTNPSASNYNPLATNDDGNCTFPGVDCTHPIVGGAGEFVGACFVNDCRPFTYPMMEVHLEITH